MTVLSNSLTVSDGGLGISAAGQRPVVVAGCCSSGAVAAPTTVDTLDGLTVETDDWWFNVRPSNTEPLLRLNVEAADADRMTALRDAVLGVMRGEG